ncbi:hypothetical protein LSH36_108g00005 [Paralvinella palmiformis]|uniref:Uncharacterized protein n=1 Tax=Paralvinella palmiformis TaxID=53620 RepID=A0AAD9JZ20_9ANNE|nr:hypothetical protein LSH36_108g00005 [Paralvinella palmiformis]
MVIPVCSRLASVQRSINVCVTQTRAMSLSRHVLNKKRELPSLKSSYLAKRTATTANRLVLNKKKTPPGPKSLPLIGTLYKYIPYVGSYSMTDQQRTDTRRFKQYGPVVREEVIPGQVMYYVYDPALFPQVFSQEPKYPTRFAMEGFRAYRESRGQHPGFPNSFGEEWHKIRQPTNQLMLKRNVVSSYTRKQDIVAKDMIKLIDERRNDKNEVDDLLNILYRFGMEEHKIQE